MNIGPFPLSRKKQVHCEIRADTAARLDAIKANNLHTIARSVRSYGVTHDIWIGKDVLETAGVDVFVGVGPAAPRWLDKE